MRRFLGKFFLVFVGITLALVGIEILLRVQASLVRSRQVREQREQRQITLPGATVEFMQRYDWEHPVPGNRRRNLRLYPVLRRAKNALQKTALHEGIGGCAKCLG